MNLSFSLNGIKNIVFNPAKFWETIISEHPSAGIIRNSLFIPLVLLVGMSAFFGSLLFVNIIGFYGLYIFWVGTEKLLNTPQYKKMPLLIVATITFAGLYIATDLLLSMITDRVYYSFLA